MLKLSCDCAAASATLGDMPPMTNASWRLTNWMSEYAQLMRALRTESGRVFGGLCQLFELYLLHIFHTFSDVSLAELSSPNRQQQVSFDALTHVYIGLSGTEAVLMRN